MQTGGSRGNRSRRVVDGQRYSGLWHRVEQRAPGIFDGALKVYGLHAHQRQTGAPRQDASRTRTARELQMLFEHAAKPGVFFATDIDEIYEVAMHHFVRARTQYISQAASHSGAKVHAHRAEDQRDAAGHVFAAVLAETFNDSQRATVAHREALAGASGNIKLAGSGTVEHGISRQHIATARGRRARRNTDRSAGKSFAHVIVGLTGKLQREARSQKRAEALSRRTVKFATDFRGEASAFAAPAHHLAADTRAHAAIGIADGLRFRFMAERTTEVARVFER